MESSLNKCYLCGETGYDAVRGRVRDRPELSIRKCRRCGLVYLSSCVSVRDDIYRGLGVCGEQMEIADWMRESAVDDQRRAQYCAPLVSGKRVLDFGCGNGGFLLRVKDIAETAIGVDVEAALVPHFRRYGIDLFLSLDDVDSSFDVITVFHVLEHLADPRSVLLKLRLLLAENGQMLIEVPNANEALLQLYQCEAFSNFVYWSPHLFMYTAETLLMLCQCTGSAASGKNRLLS